MDANNSFRIRLWNVSFNPRARDGRENKNYMADAEVVSIHAPVMDAKLRPDLFSLSTRFNPRARDGREE